MMFLSRSDFVASRIGLAWCWPPEPAVGWQQHGHLRWPPRHRRKWPGGRWKEHQAVSWSPRSCVLERPLQNDGPPTASE